MSRTFPLLSLAACLASHFGGAATAQKKSLPARKAARTTAMTYACPMHADVTASKPGGKCPRCRMSLVAVATPPRGGPEVEFKTMFPAPGFYRVWTQFQRAGKIVTASFTLKVRAGS